MARLFGTDGVRGVANVDLTPELALGLAAAAAHVLAGDATGRRQAVLGRDPRASGEMLSAAVVAGLTSAGVDVLDVGVLPTPATAYLTKALDADFGVMLSASHNPMPDNGVKLFARGGVKLADHLEDAIEARLDEPWDRPVGEGVGRVHDIGAEARERYVAHLCSTIDVPLDGLRVVLDCAHGAASWVGPEVLARAGAEVVTFAAEPDGVNINDHVGSTHLDGLVEVVRSTGVDAGFALDGDADRCLAVDASGELVDGDQIMAVLAVALHERGELTDDTVVATVMSNLGFRIAMESAGIKVVETGVGDRYVLEAMRAGGFALGGEQSGHVILDAHSTTGDGVLTALQVLARMATARATLAELAGVVDRLPQVLINVDGVDRSRVDTSPELAEAVAAASAELGATGRVLLRPSGTEPLVRVMVEAATADIAGAVADRLAAAVRSALA